jgi:TrmH family RNA methyltransferase
VETITSPHNPLLKRIRRLIDSPRERRKDRVAVLDGVHLLESYAARFGLKEATVLLAEGNTAQELKQVLQVYRPGRLVEVPDGIVNALSPLDTPTGVMAVVPIPAIKPASASAQFWIVLDGVQDPGNLGSILRTAAASGATRAVLSPACADPWGPKCLRGGMGAQFVLPVHDHADLSAALADFPGAIYAADGRGQRLLFDADLAGNAAVVLGAEGTGLSREILQYVHAVLRIPVSEGIESLNVAAAAAMICGERLRQQRSKA